MGCRACGGSLMKPRHVASGRRPPSCARPVLRLPAHLDVGPALRILRDAGRDCRALEQPASRLSRSSHHRLSPLFDEIMSVDEAGALKPAPEVRLRGQATRSRAVRCAWSPHTAGTLPGRRGLDCAARSLPGQSSRQNPFALPEIIAGDLLTVPTPLLDLERLSHT